MLLEAFKPIALQEKWFWAKADLSESAVINEEALANRILTDLAASIANFINVPSCTFSIGFHNQPIAIPCTYPILKDLYEKSPGLVSDKLKNVLEFVWNEVKHSGRKGIVFVYDEAQNLKNNDSIDQFPLSMLLDVFQSLQAKGMRFLLILSGLPTLFPKLVEARTFAERMFEVTFLHSLNKEDTEKAIQKPFQKEDLGYTFSMNVTQQIWEASHGYPYFIQYICCEISDLAIQNSIETELSTIHPNTIDTIIRKLDTDFFAGRWSRVTDRQRDLLKVISSLTNCDSEFSVQEIVEHFSNKKLTKSFGSSNVNQMLASLSNLGLIYKNRYGKYSFAVPLFGQFIQRQE